MDGNGTQYVGSATYYPSGTEYQRFMPHIYFRTSLNPRLQVIFYYSDNGQVNSFFIDKTYNYGLFHQNNGNVMAITNNKDANRTQTFTYDLLNRISSGSSTANTGAYSWGENYSVDAWGNLQIAPMSGKAHGGNFALNGDVQNRPTGMAYDSAGNLMSYFSATYIYDQENRLSSTAGTAYTYDGNGERVLKSNTSNGAAVKRYWSMGGTTLAEGDGTGNLTAEYIYFGGRRVARIDLPANTVHYYLSDHLGSTSIVVSAAGAVEEESDYYPFGIEVVVTAGANKYKFTGKERDSETGLDYFGARFNGSALGRFTTPDPSMGSVRLENPQTWNRYSYALNNPLKFIDPTGEEWNVAGQNGGTPTLEWTDTCGVADQCIQTAAVANQNGVTVYGTLGADDVNNYGVNSKGYVDLSDMAGSSGPNFGFQNGVDATYATPQTGAGLYNAAAAYGQEHPGDAKLSLNDVGSEDGSHIAPHQTHNLGRSIDMRYMDNDGNPVTGYGEGNILRADDNRMGDLIGDFQQNGFNQIYSDNDQSYGTQWAPGHGSHIHMGKNISTAQSEHRATTPPKQPGPH